MSDPLAVPLPLPFLHLVDVVHTAGRFDEEGRVGPPVAVAMGAHPAVVGESAGRLSVEGVTSASHGGVGAGGLHAGAGRGLTVERIGIRRMTVGRLGFVDPMVKQRFLSVPLGLLQERRQTAEFTAQELLTVHAAAAARGRPVIGRKAVLEDRRLDFTQEQGVVVQVVQRGIGHRQNGIALTADDVHLQEVHVKVSLRAAVRVEVVRLVFVDHVELGRVHQRAGDLNIRLSFRLVVQTILLRAELLFLDTEEMQNHRPAEQNRSKEEQNLLLRLEGPTQKRVSPIQPT